METFGSAPALVLITKGGATNIALTVATPCYLHIYSTKNAFKKKKKEKHDSRVL